MSLQCLYKLVHVDCPKYGHSGWFQTAALAFAKWPYKCQYCEVMKPFDEIKALHEPNCRRPCPNHCNAQFMTMRYQPPSKDRLPATGNRVRFRTVGCTAKVQRKDMPTHLFESAREQAAMAMPGNRVRFRTVGCTAKVWRKDMPTHLFESAREQAAMAMLELEQKLGLISQN